MGMRAGSVSAASASQSTAVSNWQQNQQNVKTLFSALKSGDLNASQQAYSALTANSGSNAIANSNSPLAQIGQALLNGDLAGAQKVAQAMQSGHHHHHGGGQNISAASSSSAPTPASSTIGSVVNTTA